MISTLFKYIVFVVLFVYLVNTSGGQLALTTVINTVQSFRSDFLAYLPIEAVGAIVLFMFGFLYLMIKD